MYFIALCPTLSEQRQHLLHDALPAMAPRLPVLCPKGFTVIFGTSWCNDWSVQKFCIKVLASLKQHRAFKLYPDRNWQLHLVGMLPCKISHPKEMPRTVQPRTWCQSINMPRQPARPKHLCVRVYVGILCARKI